uniref:Derlin n=1 Tax=Grammatophora oceanica TaxID=210454 RepID=A0A7S1Y7R4_9STRA|mmetsp:Transcript_29528/g.43553  ORF Transcript_29528/g.43553 Transcript_29528/m.43553 type:complete len:292 (+) Transcript_29528:291-1166(+)|eukprot:CAMPEP_0194039110 /NCGR_PEP_ID=MMETSP0009_2-20130614/11286_1 /TAXON_ID=210454 /ORGANISM="Grammatophora oceanica, Strain CCMP 410" /LENGTH=291 /DNA_ID=CAMNT_0038681847 /DNA_START=211 /DNA_END=1086 /DNA_ORIENTATION=+
MKRPRVFILRLCVVGFLGTTSLGSGIRRPSFLAAGAENVGAKRQNSLAFVGDGDATAASNYYRQYEQRNSAADLDTQQRTSFFAVVLVSTANMLINWYRDDVLTPQVVRIPRVIWELVLMILSLQATIAQQAVPGLYAMLSLMLGSTAVGDLFFWAPMFAVASMFERINLATSPRFLLLLQSLVVGFIYLFSSVNAWGAYLSSRDEQKIKRDLRAKEIWRQELANRRRGGGGRIKQPPSLASGEKKQRFRFHSSIGTTLGRDEAKTKRNDVGSSSSSPWWLRDLSHQEGES